jgi:SAM-dependent methyltransferase
MRRQPGPSCSCCYDKEFDAATARRDLKAYRRNGPGPTARRLAVELAGDDVGGSTVLDIGGGIGALHRLLLQAGAAQAVDVDASAPYLEAAQHEATAEGLADRVTFVHANLVEVARALETADLVGLDRVVCCYPDVDALVGAAASLARRRLGVAVPPDGRLARLVVLAINGWQRVIGSRLRMHAHDHGRIRAAAEATGMRWRETVGVGFWRVLVFERVAADGMPAERPPA